MVFFKNNSIKELISLAGFITVGIFTTSPSFALDYPSSLDNVQGVTNQILAQSSSPGLLEPEPGSWRCINNSNPVCKNPPRNLDSARVPGNWLCLNSRFPECQNPSPFTPSASDYKPGTWICINNPRSECGNPIISY